jgi:hypothetical protein
MFFLTFAEASCLAQTYSRYGCVSDPRGFSCTPAREAGSRRDKPSGKARVVRQVLSGSVLAPAKKAAVQAPPEQSPCGAESTLPVRIARQSIAQELKKVVDGSVMVG